MTHKDFNDLQYQLLQKVLQISETKGKEYANSDSDRLANFKRTAEKCGVSPLTVLNVFLTKHMDSLDSYVRQGRTFSTESIESRIVDAITYLTLFYGLVIDKEEMLKDVEHKMHMANQYASPEPYAHGPRHAMPEDVTGAPLSHLHPVYGTARMQKMVNEVINQGFGNQARLYDPIDQQRREGGE